MDVRGPDPRFSPSSRLSAVRFLTYTGQEIRSVSCKKITNPNTFDSLLHPNQGGLYDPALGPCDKHDLCGTCGLNYVHCPGHMGHIPLSLPVYHPIFFTTLYQLLRSSCCNCHRLLCAPIKAHLLRGQLELVDHGLLSDAVGIEATVTASEGQAGYSADNIVQSVADYVENCKHACRLESPNSSAQLKTKNLVEFKRMLVADFLKTCTGVPKCPHCSAPVRTVRQEHRVRVFLKGLSKKLATAWVAARNKEIARRREAVEEREDTVMQMEEGSTDLAALVTDTSKTFVTVEDCLEQSYLSPVEARDHMRELWANEKLLMDSMFGCTHQTTAEGHSPADMFFLDVVPVPPSRFRPVSKNVSLDTFDYYIITSQPQDNQCVFDDQCVFDLSEPKEQRQYKVTATIYCLLISGCVGCSNYGSKLLG